MNLGAKIIALSLVLVIAAIAGLAWNAILATEVIDLCWDNSSPRYIQDEKLRNAACPK
jgi:hypothetical protein